MQKKFLCTAQLLTVFLIATSNNSSVRGADREDLQTGHGHEWGIGDKVKLGLYDVAHGQLPGTSKKGLDSAIEALNDLGLEVHQHQDDKAKEKLEDDEKPEHGYEWGVGDKVKLGLYDLAHGQLPDTSKEGLDSAIEALNDLGLEVHQHQYDNSGKCGKWIIRCGEAVITTGKLCVLLGGTSTLVGAVASAESQITTMADLMIAGSAVQIAGLGITSLCDSLILYNERYNYGKMVGTACIVAGWTTSWIGSTLSTTCASCGWKGLLKKVGLDLGATGIGVVVAGMAIVHGALRCCHSRHDCEECQPLLKHH